MATRKRLTETVPGITQAKDANHAYKPLYIGLVIKETLAGQGITPVQFAEKIGVNKRNIHRLLRAKWLSMPKLLKYSEVLNRNLLLEYHPNIEPQPNPLLAENEALKKELATLKNYEQENMILKAKLEVLEKVMMGRLRND